MGLLSLLFSNLYLCMGTDKCTTSWTNNLVTWNCNIWICLMVNKNNDFIFILIILMRMRRTTMMIMMTMIIAHKLILTVVMILNDTMMLANMSIKICEATGMGHQKHQLSHVSTCHRRCMPWESAPRVPCPWSFRRRKRSTDLGRNLGTHVERLSGWVIVSSG